MTGMDLLEYLEKEFGKNEPIFEEEIENNEVRVRLKMSQHLVREGWIAEYSENIYYIPIQTPFGRSTLSPNKIYEKKYVRNKLGVIGYYSGIKLLNLMGLTTQVPNILEIATNKATEDKQRVKEGYTSIELKKPVVEVTKENVDTLQLLEAVAVMQSKTYYKLNDDNVREIFKTYLANHIITRQDIEKYVLYYPENVKNELYESGLINDLNLPCK